jgi:hypothetical protein
VAYWNTVDGIGSIAVGLFWFSLEPTCGALVGAVG